MDVAEPPVSAEIQRMQRRSRKAQQRVGLAARAETQQQAGPADGGRARWPSRHNNIAYFSLSSVSSSVARPGSSSQLLSEHAH
jgi:hypothetical protein